MTDATTAQTDTGSLDRARDLSLATWSDYVVLLKPRVMSLVIFTGLVGLIAAPAPVHPVMAFTALLCIAIGAGASGALNMWFDADIDRVMERTQARPVPRGVLEPDDALGFGLFLAVASVAAMGLFIHWLAAGLLALTIAYYVLFYTMWLKRRTSQNIVIGGAAGALPPVIGWAAATGTVGLEALVLFLIIFMWTPPHSWALALNRSEDYARAQVPMLPVVAGEAATKRQIVLYSVLMVAVTLLPCVLGFVGLVYTVSAVVLGAVFLAIAVALWRTRNAQAQKRAAGRLFAYSILYLFLLFLLVAGEHVAGLTPLPPLVSL